MRMDWERTRKSSGKSPLEFAAIVYEQRNRSKEDREKLGWGNYAPLGFKVGNNNSKQYGFDHRVWYPHPDEVRPCCQGLAQPKFNYPWIYQRHCRTLRHVALLFNVDESDLREATGTTRVRNQCECGKFRRSDDYLCKKCREALDSQPDSC